MLAQPWQSTRSSARGQQVPPFRCTAGHRATDPGGRGGQVKCGRRLDDLDRTQSETKQRRSNFSDLLLATLDLSQLPSNFIADLATVMADLKLPSSFQSSLIDAWREVPVPPSTARPSDLYAGCLTCKSFVEAAALAYLNSFTFLARTCAFSFMVLRSRSSGFWQLFHASRDRFGTWHRIGLVQALLCCKVFESAVKRPFLFPLYDNWQIPIYKGHVYVIGGLDDDDGANPVARVDRLDVNGGAVTTLCSMRQPRRWAAAIVYEECIFVFGGEGSGRRKWRLASCEKYDPVADKQVAGITQIFFS